MAEMTYAEFERHMEAVEIASARQTSDMSEAEWYALVEQVERELEDGDAAA